MIPAQTLTILTTLLQTLEGFRKHAYDDKHPDRELQLGDSVEGTLTIGYGTTLYPATGGQRVQIGDVVTKSEAIEYLQAYIRQEVFPVLENLVHVPLTANQWAALGSLVYQYGADEVSGWRLFQRINEQQDWQSIILEWINGTVYWMDKPLFWGRRATEAFLYMGLDWRAGKNVPAGTNLIEAIETMQPDPLTIPEPGHRQAVIDATADPTPETPLTTEDLNYQQYVEIGGTESFETVQKRKVQVTAMTPKVDLQDVAYLDDEAKAAPKVKRVRDSQRGKGDIKQAVGEKTFIAGAAGSAATAIGAAEPIIRTVDKYPHTAIAVGFTSLLAIGVVTFFWGKWQRQKGENEATELLG